MRLHLEVERARNRLSRGEIAERAGVTSSTYTAWVKGRAIPSDKLEKLADVFGVSCDYLLGRTEEREVWRREFRR